MLEGTRTKGDEQYPLLMVSAGSGDGGKASPKNLSSMWNVTSYTPRRSWLQRVPEFLATCWMTFVLIGIIFMVFYSVGMLVYKRDTLFLIKFNENKTANNVYLHHFVHRTANGLSFSNYADYLSEMSMKYPALQFNVIFLLDDSPYIEYGAGFRHSSRFLMPRLPRNPLALGEWEKHEILDFERQHSNVKTTVTLVSRYMSMTPLKNKWHMIPTSLLGFYARVFSVWQNSGIGIDLAAYNNKYKKNNCDWRLESVLKEHNEGIKSPIIESPKPTIARQKEREVETELFSQMFALLQYLLSNSRNSFNSSEGVMNKTHTELKPDVDKDQRIKRDMPGANEDQPMKRVKGSDNHTKENNLMMDLISAVTTDNNTFYNTTPNETLNNTTTPFEVNATDINYVNKTGGPQGIVIFYDISLVVGPPLDAVAKALEAEAKPLDAEAKPLDAEAMKSESPQASIVNIDGNRKLVSVTTKAESRQTGSVNIDGYGLFVSATVKYHPFLFQIIDAGCRKMLPKIAILDALMTQCNSYLRDDLYCDNIHIL